MKDNYQTTETFFADDDRVDGISKVTGKATFSAEHNLDNLARWGSWRNK